MNKTSVIESYSKNLKKNILYMAKVASSKSAHIGGAFSLSEIISVIFCNYFKKPETKNSNRNRIILSKGHACLALYGALYQSGFIKKKILDTFEESGSDLLGHPIKNRKIGIDFSTGSLGMGLSLGTGVAIGLKKKKINKKVFVIIGDGECNEGMIWESAMLVPHLKLNNIIAIIDNNNFQQTGSLKEILTNNNLKQKWKSFGWNVKEVDGHNIKNLNKILTKKEKTTKPLLVLAKTVKGNKINLFKNDNKWHHSVLTEKNYNDSIEFIEKKK